MQKYDNYEFRSSAVGRIMSSRGEITQGNDTYLKEMFIGETYGIRKDISTKYFEKGNLTEEDGITMLQNTIHSNKLVLKNKKRIHNGFVHGECDCVVGDTIYDIKSAYTLFTFGTASLTDVYYWQLVAYMWLWDKPKARLFYSLNNTPEHMIMDEERKLFYTGRFTTMESPDYLEACEELRKLHVFDHMPLEERFKIWEIERKESDIEKLKEKIIKCRERLNKMEDERLSQIDFNKSLMLKKVA